MAPRRAALANARKTVGYTQESFAEAARVDRSTVVRWEAGQSEPSPHLRPALARLLNVNIGELESLLTQFDLSPSSQRADGMDGAPFPVEGAEGLAPFQSEGARVVPAGNLSDVLDSMGSLHAALAVQDNALGPAVVAPVILHQLAIMKGVGRGASGPLREMLTRVQALYAETAGWLSDDLGDRKAGQFWTDRALEWAHEADDRELIGYVLTRKSQRAADDGDHFAAISLSRAASRYCAGTPRVRAAAALYGALGYAAAGNTHDFRLAVDRANEVTEGAAPSRHGEAAAWCNAGYVLVHEAAGYMKLDEPQKAVIAYKKGLRDWPESLRRDQGLYRSRLARAHIAARQPEQALASGRAALEIAGQTRSSRTLGELGALSRSLAGWKVPAVVSFSDEFRAVTSRLARGCDESRNSRGIQRKEVTD